MPHAHKAIINEKIENLLKQKRIEPSNSEFNSPLLLVRKKGDAKGEKGYRLIVDYRGINRILTQDRYQLPRIDEIFDSLGGAKFFSVIDLDSGFYQIPLNENSRNVTSFSTELGSYQWTVVPFGISVAPSSFSRCMSIAFSGLPLSTVVLYLDDLLIPGKNETDQVKNIRKVLEVCRYRNLKINPK